MGRASFAATLDMIGTTDVFHADADYWPAPARSDVGVSETFSIP